MQALSSSSKHITIKKDRFSKWLDKSVWYRNILHVYDSFAKCEMSAHSRLTKNKPNFPKELNIRACGFIVIEICTHAFSFVHSKFDYICTIHPNTFWNMLLSKEGIDKNPNKLNVSFGMSVGLVKQYHNTNSWFSESIIM